MSMTWKGFGKVRFMDKRIFTFPNILTGIRILIVPFFIYCLFHENITYNIIAFIMFLIASITDLVDGYLARKWRMETELGKFLDPLADKILVLGAFITFILLHEQIETWMVLIIIARDMLITTLRYLGIRRGKSIKTTMWGKVKTAFQMGAIIIILIFLMVVSIRKQHDINEMYKFGRSQGLTSIEIANNNFNKFAQKKYDRLSPFINDLSSFVPYYVMLLTTLITVLSGIRYLITNYQLLIPSSRE